MRQQIVFALLCLLIVLGALGFAGWTLVTGQIYRQGIDALFLVTVCLLIVLMFAPIPVGAFRRGEVRQWLQSLKRSGAKADGANQPLTPAEPAQSSENAKQQSV
jgi:hypothetical protein